MLFCTPKIKYSHFSSLVPGAVNTIVGDSAYHRNTRFYVSNISLDTIRKLCASGRISIDMPASLCDITFSFWLLLPHPSRRGEGDGMIKSERRITPRYNLNTPLSFHRTESVSDHVQGARALNISSRGIYFASTQLMSVGESIEILLKMPSASPVQKRLCADSRVALRILNRQMYARAFGHWSSIALLRARPDSLPKRTALIDSSTSGGR